MPRILIVDDSEVVRQRIEDTLSRGGLCDEFLVAKDGVEGIRILLNEQADLVLCDVVMPNIDGYKFLSLKKQHQEFDEIPVIMITGQDDVTQKVRGLEAGASDYVTKPFHEQELVARVRVHLNNKELRDTLRRKNLQLEQLARIDPLTGISNRRHFMSRFEDEVNRANRHDRALGYIMLDIDFFKRINDEHGHLVGDEVLIEIGKILGNTIRGHDIVGRYGGEEFGAILPEADAKGAARVADRCRKNIAATRLAVGSGGKIQFTASFGVSARVVGQGTKVKDLIRLADDALYQAKTEGRNCVAIAHRCVSVG